MLLIGIGLSTSNVLMSCGEIGLGIAFIWDAKYKAKFQLLLKDKRMLALMTVYLLFILGLIHTSNFAYAFKDLRIKLPILVVPFLAFSFFPLTQKEFKLIFHSIYAGILFTMAMALLIYLKWIDWKIEDMRNYSPFVSNVRLGTLLVFSIISSIYFVFNKTNLFVHKYLYILFALLCLVFLLLIQSLTGIVALVGCLLVMVIYGLSKKENRKAAILGLVLFLLLGGTITLLTLNEYRRIHWVEKINFDELPKTTSHGEGYLHYPNSTETINGHYVFINICHPELKTEWSKRSKLDYDGLTNKGWPVSGTLIQYLTSKGEKKNAEAVQELSDMEIHAIENGVANFLNLHALDIRGRINQFWIELDEYKKDGEPNGKSFATRLETWKVACLNIRESALFGYGTGDVRDQMEKKYVETKSKLIATNYLNSHQQYLTVAMAVGIVGLMLFIGFIFYPLIRFKHLHILFVIALTISGIAMLDEDTLETQAGCTQFIFIYVVTYMLHLERKSIM